MFDYFAGEHFLARLLYDPLMKEEKQLVLVNIHAVLHPLQACVHACMCCFRMVSGMRNLLLCFGSPWLFECFMLIVLCALFPGAFRSARS